MDLQPSELFPQKQLHNTHRTVHPSVSFPLEYTLGSKLPSAHPSRDFEVLSCSQVRIHPRCGLDTQKDRCSPDLFPFVVFPHRLAVMLPQPLLSWAFSREPPDTFHIPETRPSALILALQSFKDYGIPPSLPTEWNHLEVFTRTHTFACARMCSQIGRAHV